MGTNRQTTPQSITVEYTVRGSLDGVTPAPLVQIDQSRPDATPFDQTAQIYRPPPVDNLGLIDPDLLVGGSIGTRCIPFLSLDTTEVGAAGASVDIVGVRGSPSDVFFQKQIEDLAGDAGPIYLDGGFNVPQGSDIRLRGYTAAPGEEIRVRVTLLVPDNCLDIAAFHCPCPPNGNGPPPPPVDAGCLGKFLVAKQEDCAPFTSIGEAYQAAKDAGHGYGQPNGPAQVLVCPGDYDESLVMDRAGIDVIAVAKNPSGQNATVTLSGSPVIEGETRMAGSLLVDFAPTGGEPARASWQGIDIEPESGFGVRVAGANPKEIKINDCIIRSVDNSALLGESSAVGDVTKIDLRNVTLGTLSNVNVAVGIGIPDPNVETLLRTWNVSIAVPGQNASAMTLQFATGIFFDSTVFGQTQLISSFVTSKDTSYQANQATSAVNIDVDSFMNSIDDEFLGQSGGNGGSWVDGDGFFIHDSVTTPGDLDWGLGLFVIPSQGLPQEQHWTFVDLDAIGTFRITSECNLLVNGPFLPGPVLELPPSLFRPGPIRIIEDGQASGAPITLSVTTLAQAPPGDLIVVGTDPPAPTVTLPPAGPGVSGGYMLVSNGRGLWYVMCFCQDGGAANCLTQALVSPDPTLAPFQSIQLAYDFLVGLGADETFPAKVLVCPGEYLEDVAMTQAGIDIVACDQDPYNQLRVQGFGITRLNGTVTMALTGAGDPDLNSAAWRGIDVAPGGCVAAGTQIETPDGPRAVESLEKGDTVWAVDPKTGRREATKIRAITKSTRECLRLTAGEQAMVCTPSHRVYSPEAGAFHHAARWGDGAYSELLAVTDEGVEARKATTETYAGLHDVYDLAVESNLHTFIADGFVVHNKTTAFIFSDGVPIAERQIGFVSDCLLAGSQNDPGVLGTTTTFGSTLDCVHVGLVNTSEASAAGFEWATDGGFLLLSDCHVRGDQNNDVGPDATLQAVGTRFLNGTNVGDAAANGGVVEATDCSFTSGPAFSFLGPGPIALGIVDLLRCDTPPDPVIGLGSFIYDFISTSASFSPSFDGITTPIQNASIPHGAHVLELVGDGPHPPLTGAETNIVVSPATAVAVSVILPPAVARCGPVRVKKNPDPAVPGTVVAFPVAGETINTVAAGLAVTTVGTTFVSWLRPGATPDDWETYG